MSNAKHTPGPWRTHQGADDGEGGVELDRWLVVVDGPKPYLVATIENGAPGDTLMTEAANATLFAAAPDLLAACRLALSFGEAAVRAGLIGFSKRDEDGIVRDHVDLKVIRAAIAKAGG